VGFLAVFLLSVHTESLAALNCAQCHKDVTAKQAKTAMANTWLPVDRATAPDDSSLHLPVSFEVGGKRHGVGFLSYISQIAGIPLARKTLIQARYAWSPEHQKLLLAPGCSSAKPETLEEKLGLVLSPTFEKRCLSCHGQAGKGVRCDNCHSSTEHPSRRLTTEESMAVCAQCHVGLTKFSDPTGDDLLVANQVEAIQRSECYLQSGKAFSCTTCHDPHEDATDDKNAVRACLTCHSLGVKKHAGICPVNATEGCIGCHMPSVEMGPLHLVDHLIRVHPEQKVQTSHHSPELKSEVEPISAYLRMIATNTEADAQKAMQRIRAGESFYDVARAMSVDPTAVIGGYLGRRKWVPSGEPKQEGGRWVIYERLPRDFKWQAEQLEREAEATGSISKAQDALKIYPHYLRALNFIGVTEQRPEVLRVAAKLYPEDASTKFALASVLEAKGQVADAEKTFEQTITLEKDFTAAYVRLGTIQYQAGDWRNALATFRQGLQIDPLSVELNQDLGLALLKTGDAVGAQQATALAEHLR
jgi:predicted CXXCH cytochrome family protein